GRSLEAMPKIDYLVGPYYYYSLAVLVLATLCMWRIVHSPFGLCLKTIRDNPAKAETLGIGVTRYRFHAFVISAVYAAVGGALLGPPIGNVDPTLAYWTHSGNIVFMTLLGGFCALDGMSLGFAAGEFVSIIGPNGAGTSPLINILTGLTPPSAGTVRFKEREIHGLGPVRLARLGMARSFQLVHIFPDLTV